MEQVNNRRKFLLNTAALGAGVLLSSPFSLSASDERKEKKYTVGEIMDTFIAQLPGAPFKGTVDTLKSGSRDMVVSAIVTTMFATVKVIKEAIALKANFIIVHEPTFYSHEDKTSWLENDEVYLAKRALLSQHNLSIWRNHDYIHQLNPDGVMTGVLDQLGWKQYSTNLRKGSLKIPEVSLEELIGTCKKKLGISMVRYIGDLAQRCTNIMLMPGASGGEAQISAIREQKPDVLIVGEISEWETAEYVRDAREEGRNVSLIILGHIPSEEPGSVFMRKWLMEHFPAIKVHFLKDDQVLSFQ